MKLARLKIFLLPILLALLLFAWGCDDSDIADDSSTGLAMEESDCLPDEYYDPVDEACYVELECETEEECDRLEEEYYGDIEGLDDDFTAGSQQFSDTLAVQETKLVSYDVQGDEIVNPLKEAVSAELTGLRDDSAKHEALWQYYVSFVPDSHLGYVSGFDIFTDGAEESLAAVYQDERDPGRWILAVDITDAYPDGSLDKEDFTYSLIHEFGHILTLNETQVNVDPELMNIASDQAFDDLYDRKREACQPSYFTYEGCSNRDSYINGFYQEYWDDIFEKHEANQYIEDDEDYWEATDAFYERYSDRFVNDYAATNPGEDIAESFTQFILKDRPRGSSIKDQKVEFFYEYPELVKLRKFMRSRLDL